MKASLPLGGIALAFALGLSACTNPYDPGQRAVGGGLIGAGAGAAIGGRGRRRYRRGHRGGNRRRGRSHRRGNDTAATSTAAAPLLIELGDAKAAGGEPAARGKKQRRAWGIISTPLLARLNGRQARRSYSPGGQGDVQ
jgi:hypothetical protein